jgi:uncharacterized protein (TIGR03083 family)
MDDATTWKLIHEERAAMVDTLTGLNREQWSKQSLCGDWSVQTAAGHILAGAEQTKPQFVKRMAANGFRFNTMIDRDARRVGALPPTQIIERLRATTTATNGPPAPVVTMLGEIVVHGDDIRRPLGLSHTPKPEALTRCLDMYCQANFPLGSKKRIAGLHLVATDIDWTRGEGPTVSGPGLALVSAIAGRAAALDSLTGDGLTTLRQRVGATAI